MTEWEGGFGRSGAHSRFLHPWFKGSLHDSDIAHDGHERGRVVDYWHWWTYWLPAVWVMGNLMVAREWWEEFRQKRVARPKRQLTWLEFCVRMAAVFLGGWAMLLTAVHLIAPRCPVNDLTLELADEFLVRPEHKSDFEFLLRTAPCRGKRLGAVLQHVELANLQRRQFYPELEAHLFQQFILSPMVDTLPLQELDWRRPLWENFHPRVRRETDPVGAAQIVVRFLRERVGISPEFPYRVGVETIWMQGMTDEPGFERIYVAALRSVGVAARLNGNRQAELWTRNEWQSAPRPMVLTPGASGDD